MRTFAHIVLWALGTAAVLFVVAVAGLHWFMSRMPH